jgi:hypothetical protein
MLTVGPGSAPVDGRRPSRKDHGKRTVALFSAKPRADGYVPEAM